MNQTTTKPRQDPPLGTLLVLLAVAAVGALGVGQVHASSDDSQALATALDARSASAERRQHRRPRPQTSRMMTPAIRHSLERAFTGAITLVHEDPQCAALFDKFGADGEDRLSRTIYVGVPYGDRARCEKRNALALTRHGSVVVRLCPTFAELGTHDAELALIHEALHFAGLPEFPPTPGALTAQEIQEMVEGACSATLKAPQPGCASGVLLATTAKDPRRP